MNIEVICFRERERGLFFMGLTNFNILQSTSVKATPNSRKIYLRDLNGYVTDMLSDSGFKFSEEYEASFTQFTSLLLVSYLH